MRDSGPPADHVVIFDEAQRAWNEQMTASFMLRKKKRPGFTQSEPEFLIAYLDRHPDWAVVVCLVGGGQEINTGEAGISAWLDAVQTAFPSWHIHWFLNGPEDTRSSFYLEHAATEFQIQGLELDWVCVTWDADLRFADKAWDYRSFRGSESIRKADRRECGLPKLTNSANKEGNESGTQRAPPVRQRQEVKEMLPGKGRGCPPGRSASGADCRVRNGIERGVPGGNRSLRRTASGSING